METPSNFSQIDLSIVVPTHCRKASLLRLVRSLLRFGKEARLTLEVIVVDSSPKNSFSTNEILALNSASNTTLVKYFPLSSKGVNKKRNFGLSHAQGPITLFIDDDCEVTDAIFFKKHLQLHQKDPNALIIGGGYSNQVYGLAAKIYDSTYKKWVMDSANGPPPPFVGGNLSMKTDERAPWIRFDEGLSFGGTEKELILRALAKGYSCKYFDNLTLTHHVEVSLRGLAWKAFCQGRNEGLLWQRYPQLISSPTSSQELPQQHLAAAYNFFFHCGLNYYDRHRSSPTTLNKITLSMWRTLALNSRTSNFFRSIQSSFIYRALHRSYWVCYGRLFSPVMNFFYWRLWWKAGHHLSLLCRGNHVLIYRFIHCYGLGVRFYWKTLFPIQLTLSKPYYFLKYQFEKRIIGPLQKISEALRSL